MNWPAPTLSPPAAASRDDEVASPDAPSTPPIETVDERRRLSAVPAAAWVAVVGAALVMLSAALVVASNWDALGRGIRFGAMVVCTLGLVAAAERLREIVPTTSAIVAHVGAYLAAPIGIAGASMLSFTWPTCLLVGGILALLTTEIQARRWHRTTMFVGQVVAISLAATGLAAMASTSAGVIAAIAAAVLLAAGAQRRAAGLAVLAVLSPALTALADAGIGSGTFERAGLVGEKLSWSGPVVGLLAATVLAIVATQRRNNGLMLTAALAPIIGLITGLAAIDSSAAAWLAVPALIVIAVELSWWMLPSERFRSPIATTLDVLAGALGVFALGAPFIVVNLELVGTRPWALPSVITVLALALATARWRRTQHELEHLGAAALLATALATGIALGASAAVVAAVAVALVGLGAFASRTFHPASVYIPSMWAIVAILDLTPADDVVASLLPAGLLTVLIGIVAATRSRLAAENDWLGLFEIAAVIAVAAGAATDFVTNQQSAAALVGAAVGGLLIVVIDNRFAITTVAVTWLIGVVALDAATESGALERGYWVGWAAVAASLAISWLVTRSAIVGHAAAAAAVFALATSAVLTDLGPEQFVLVAIVGQALLTGLAFTLQRRSPLDGAAIAAGIVVLATTAFEIDPIWASLAWLTIGMQVFVYGLATSLTWMLLAGTGIAGAASVSGWFTSGVHDHVIEWLRPADIRVGDLWMAVAIASAFGAGAVARKAFEINSWIAYSGGLAIAGIWLGSVQVERNTVWALPFALTIGMIAVGVGAWRRLAAPLVGGTVLIAVALVLEAGSDLRDLPTWVWLAVGGLGLLGTAVLIERSGKPGSVDIRDLVQRWS